MRARTATFQRMLGGLLSLAALCAFAGSDDRQTLEWKYVVHGQTLNGRGAFVVAKFGLLGNLFLLTVYEE